MKKFTLLVLFAALGLMAEAVSPDPLTLSNWETGTTTLPTYSWTNTRTVVSDPDNSSNQVLKVDRDPTGATYLGVQWTNTVEPFKTNGVPFGNTNTSQYKYIVVKAKKSTPYDMKVKLELPQTGTNIVTLTSLNASQQGLWSYYIFDAGMVNVTHKQFSVFPEFGGNTGAATTYFDEIYFTNTLPTIDFSTYKFPLTYSTGASSATTTKTYEIARSGTNIDITLLSSQLIPGATSYNVYDGATKLTTTYDAAKYVIKITGLTRSTNYNLQITAVNASNVESSKSEIIQVSTRSNTGTGYEVADDFEGGNLGWTTYGSPTINATATNTLTTGINASTKCLSFAVTTSSNYYAMAIMPNERILAGPATYNYRYVHVKIRRPSQATGNVVLKVEKGGGQASNINQEITSISTSYNDDAWHDYVFDLGASGITNEAYYRQFDLMPNKLASGNQTASFTMYIDDIYLSNDATLSTANLSTVNIPLSLTTSTTPSGTGGTTFGNRGYLSGDGATVTATPTSNYRFVNWTLTNSSGAVLSTSSSFTYAVTSAATLCANFIKTWTYTATSADVNKGTVSGTGVYDNSASASLTATPASGYRFINWTESDTEVSTSASYTFTATANRTLRANFASNTVNITEATNTNATSLNNCTDCDITVAGATLTVNNTKSVKSITVESGAKVVAGQPLTVTGVMKLKAGKTTAPGVKVDAAISVTGNLTLEKTLDNSKWYFISVPSAVAIADIAKVSGSGTPDYGVNWWIKYYDGDSRTVNLGATSNWKTLTSGLTMEANKGYIIGLGSALTGDYVFSFPLNKTLISSAETARTVAVVNHGEALEIGANHKGWNLVGTPYLSPFTGSNVGAGFLTFHNGTTYTQSANTAVSEINAFSSFFVQASTAGTGANLSFDLAGRQAVKSAVTNTVADVLQINLSNAGGVDQTTLIVDDSQTASYTINEDLEKWLTTGTDVPQLYTLSDNIRYAFNALPASDVNQLSLGVYTKTAGQVTISLQATEFSGVDGLVLTDNQTGISTDLAKQSYTFESTAGTTDSRFTLSARRISTAIVPDGNSGMFIFSPSDKTMNIKNLKSGSVVHIYDLFGRQVLGETVKDSEFQCKLAENGMYLVQILSEGKTVTNKIVL